MNPNDIPPAQPAAAPAPSPAAEAPPPVAGASTFGRLLPLLATVAAVAFILYRGLNILDIAKVAIGLGLVIFIHELGHFLAAKLCNVRVETFSIGFGEPIPGCRFQYGETGYKIGWLPLGGYVKMLGEGENVDSEEAEEDPRSFKNKPVAQRMVIISAGVCMNLLLASACFVVAYLHGVKERTPVIGSVESGSPAWRAGIRSDMRILEIGTLRDPMFDDIRPIIMSTRKGEIVPMEMRASGGGELKVGLEPVLNSDEMHPVIGVAPDDCLTLSLVQPVRPGTAAARAVPPLQAGDLIVAAKDLSGAWVDLAVSAEDRANFDSKFGRFYGIERAARERELRVKVKRKPNGAEGGAAGEEVEVAVPPQYTRSLGLRMQMGRIAAVRKDSPADLAKPLSPAGAEKGLKQADPAVADSGDKIVEVRLPEANGTITVLTTVHTFKKAEGQRVEILDPARLPSELQAWADRNPKQSAVTLLLLRTVGHDPVQVQYELTWDRGAENDREVVSTARTPTGIAALGLCYTVEPIVDAVDPGSPAEKAGVQAGDIFVEFRGKLADDKWDKWKPIAANQWGFLSELIQNLNRNEIGFKTKRGGGEPAEIALVPEEDKTWPRADRGIQFEPDLVLNKANDLGEAFRKGTHRELRTIRMIYQNLYAMVFGRISVMTISGPLTIGNVAYHIAGEDIWQFILFIGLINVNLAVVNFLPIPVLDGGHMAFLIYEKIRGKPPNERLLEIALYAGLLCILMLMAFSTFLDFRRLFF